MSTSPTASWATSICCPLAGLLAMQQPTEHGHGAVIGAAVVKIRVAVACWWGWSRQSRLVAQTAQRLCCWAVADVVVLGAGVAHARHLYVDDVGFDSTQLLIAKAPLHHGVSAKILRHYIADGHQPVKQRLAFRSVHVQANTAFARVIVEIVAAAVEALSE